MRVKIFESVINHKINTITAEELVKYAAQMNITLTRQQAKKIVDYVRGKNINIFNDTQRAQLVREIAKTAGPQTAREANQLFMQLTQS